MKIFIIGPGGVGKSTCGKLLSRKLEYSLIDIDEIFMDEIGHIGKYIQTHGYEKYCYSNSKLFYKYLKKYTGNTVFVLSSGFLVHNDLQQLTTKHIATIQKEGTSILLLPSKSIGKSTKIVVARQLQRGFGLNESRERDKFQSRFPKYKQFGDIKIYSTKTPNEIADEMVRRLHPHLKN